jgi:3-phosphoshikimate 1-carboxyvinyltransferase
MCTAPITVKVIGEQISQPYIDMTLQSIDDFGVKIQNNQYHEYHCAGDQSYLAREYLIEGDASGASYLWGMAAVSQGEVRVENVNPLSAQGDIGFPELLSQMGCIVTKENRAITVRGPTTLIGIHADMTRMPDPAQTLAAIAACAKGETTMSGLITLRVKETDRISALHTELKKMGIDSTTGPESLTIKGGLPHGAQISTYEDHRMAMSFALLAARIDGIRIEHPEVVEKSFPDFWGTLETLGVKSVLEDTNE